MEMVFRWYRNFNSQPHKEADGAQGMSGLLAIVFQLTASQGGWLFDTMAVNTQVHFNSQPHKEADENLIVRNQCSRNFNSQPHKEADIDCLLFRLSITIFQLTASQGGWPNGLDYVPFNGYISTHSLTRRLTGIPSSANLIARLFQLTASQGGWQ